MNPTPLSLATKKIATRSGLARATVANIIAGRSRPSWAAAKRIASATNTQPVLWLEGDKKTLKAAALFMLGQNAQRS